MTQLDEPRSEAMPRGRRPDQRRKEPGPQVNVGGGERLASVAAGAILAGIGGSRRSLPGLFVAGVGGALLHRGITGHCYGYEALGIDTAEPEPQSPERQRQRLEERGLRAERSYLIDRPAEELYRYWRDFTNLPRIMTHLESVEVLDDRRSHWVASGPRILGGRFEWDAEITRDEPNAAIAWRSLPGGDVQSVGSVRFEPAPGGRGTAVHVTIDYIPPVGRLGKWIATLLGENPERQLREELRNFKRIMECGEILTVAGQPHGTCMGLGKMRRA